MTAPAFRGLEQRLDPERLEADDSREVDGRHNAYGELLKPARNKIVAHSDLEVHVDSTALGAHGEDVMVKFFENLQAYFDAVGNAIGVGPLDFRHAPGPGDVIDLVRKLNEADAAARE